MNNVQYADAFAEVLEVLKYISKDDYEKIPLEIIEVMEDYSNKDYHVAYNPKLSLAEQNFSKESKIIIAIIFRDYWANNNQKQNILNKENYDNYIENLEKEKKYNCDIFQNNKICESSNNENTNQLDTIKKLNWFQKIISKIKQLFKI